MTETSLPAAGGSYTREPDGTLRPAPTVDVAVLEATHVDDNGEPAAVAKKLSAKRPQSANETEA